MASLWLANSFGDARFAGAGEVDDARAPIARVRGPRHQTALLEAIDRGGNRAAGEVDAPADLADRLRSLVNSTSRTPKSEMHMSSDTMLRSAWPTIDRCAFMSRSQR